MKLFLVAHIIVQRIQSLWHMQTLFTACFPMLFGTVTQQLVRHRFSSSGGVHMGLGPTPTFAHAHQWLPDVSTIAHTLWDSCKIFLCRLVPCHACYNKV